MDIPINIPVTLSNTITVNLSDLQIVEYLKGRSEEERTAFLHLLADHFCKWCGRLELPCYCMNDD